ncbi:hypothetical protein D6D54_08440 [Spiroplasma poulsonii]|uniref:Lipoprotein n=1 Tax=Spiroplasma poulsonii TaxID=2138 RepID=A0A3S0SXL4_9MOLU|nr:lipoprotein [Spiroplasma poulsonii]MBW3059458.1 hypothetical protein [Spiroplasma poulsonii]MBW3059474.1 hypothetical protein [Spiroplasma poulsonii]RUP75520.1 hypothetical protein D6D54_08440 [Spiroplasma poulsonii]
MKKILSILGTITLVVTSTTNLVACNTPQEYTKEELKELKEKNKINTTNQEIRNNLEWMAAQEKPFNTVDNKYYFVVWRNDNGGDWKINKFKNNVKLNIGETHNINDSLYLFNGNFASDLKIDLQVILKNGVPLGWFFDRDNSFLKLVYRWNLITQGPNLKVDKDGMIKVS